MISPADINGNEKVIASSHVAVVKSFFSSSTARNLSLLMAIPIAMSIANSSWLYSSIGYLDPWVNVGYFLHYFDPTFGNWYYKIARLSWIIPGSIAYHIFSPIVANYLLHIGYLILSITFFYLTVARLFNQVIAFTVAACLAVFVPFHGYEGMDYQNTAAGAYYIITFYLLTTSALLPNHWRTRVIGAGAAYAATLHATISFVNLTPLLAFHYLVLHRHLFGRLPSWRLLLHACLWFLSGALALTVLLGLINVAVGRDFLFFKTFLGLVASFVRNSEDQKAWWLPWSNMWFLNIYSLRYLALIVSTLLGCAISVVLSIFQSRPSPIAISLQVQYIYVAVLWIGWQSLGQTALEPAYFAYPLYPTMFFALSGIAADWQYPTIFSRRVFWLFVTIGIVLVGSLAFPLIPEPFRFSRHADVILIGLAFFSVILFALSRGRAALILAGVLAFCALNAFAFDVTTSLAGNIYAFEEPCKDRGDAFRALLNSDRFLRPYVRDTSNMLLWWNQSEVFGEGAGCDMSVADFSKALVSLGLFGYLAPPWSGMPEADVLPRTSTSLMSSERKIAVPTADASNVKALVAKFRQIGVPLAVEGQSIIRTFHFSFDLYVVGLDSVQKASQSNRGAPPEVLKAQPERTLAGTENGKVLTSSFVQKFGSNH